MTIDPEHKAKAKAENLAIFRVMIDRRHIKGEGGGYMHESCGAMSLDKAKRIMSILREDD